MIANKILFLTSKNLDSRLNQLWLKEIDKWCKISSVIAPESGIFYLILSLNGLKTVDESAPRRFFDRARVLTIKDLYSITLVNVSKFLKYTSVHFQASAHELSEVCGDFKALHSLIWSRFCMDRIDPKLGVPQDRFMNGSAKIPSLKAEAPVHPDYDIALDDVTICVPSNRIAFLKDWIQIVRENVTRSTAISICVEPGRTNEIRTYVSERGYSGIIVSEADSWHARLLSAVTQATTNSVFTIGDDDLFSPRFLVRANNIMSKHPEISGATAAIMNLRPVGDRLSIQLDKQHSIQSARATERMSEQDISRNNFVNIVHRRPLVMDILQTAARHDLPHLMTEILFCLMVPFSGIVPAAEDAIVTLRTRTINGRLKAAGLMNGPVLGEIANAGDRNLIADLQKACIAFIEGSGRQVDPDAVSRWLLSDIWRRSVPQQQIHTQSIHDSALEKDVSRSIGVNIMRRHVVEIELSAHLFARHQRHVVVAD
ncbi:MAG: hypothetical protein NXI19_17825 [Alphaproteobacteria bacterium]|nr:hypothetical protein [Alphaproteobacteria bacterium]